MHDTDEDPPRPAGYRGVHRAGARREPTEKAEVVAYLWVIAIHAANEARNYDAARDYRGQALDVLLRSHPDWTERRANEELDRMSPQAARDAQDMGRLDNASTAQAVLALVNGRAR